MISNIAIEKITKGIKKILKKKFYTFFSNCSPTKVENN